MFNGYLQGEIVKRPGMGCAKGPKMGLVWIRSMGWVKGLCVTLSNGGCLMVPGRRTMLGAQVEREGGSLECSQLSQDGGSWVSALSAPKVVGMCKGANRDLSGLP